MTHRWDQRYKSGEYSDKEPEPVVIQAAESMQPGRALDVACGLGRHSVWLAKQGWHVTAVDYSVIALERLRERSAGLPLEIIHADLEAGGFQIDACAYDLICDCCFLWRPLFSAMAAGLRTGGVFVGVYPLAGDDQARGPINPDYLMRPAEVAGLFEGWEVLHHFEGRPGDDPERRLRAEIVVRKPA